MLWDALGCFGMLWDALGCYGMLWDLEGWVEPQSRIPKHLKGESGCICHQQTGLQQEYLGIFWDTLGCFRMLWDALGYGGGLLDPP